MNGCEKGALLNWDLQKIRGKSGRIIKEVPSVEIRICARTTKRVRRTSKRHSEWKTPKHSTQFAFSCKQVAL